ncbi:MAG: NAD(P)-dependent alcohol dehydrogenase [Dehalococcoidia bacterium]
MKAMVYTRYGSPDGLELKEVDRPAAQVGEVLIKVYASSVNSWDWDLLRGRPYVARFSAVRRPKFRILGADVAGRVEAVGGGVKRLQPGDEVFGDISGSGWGGFGEYVCAREDVLALKPAGMTFEEAAAVPQAGVLALQGLRHRGQVQPGQKVLVNGAGGGVGTFAVQIAKSYGAEVTGVDSAAKLDMLRSIGTDHVIDYTQEDFAKNGQLYDLVLDVVGYRSVFDCRRALAAGGVYVMIGGATGRIAQTALMGPFISRTSGKKMGLLLHKPNREDLDFVAELVEAGKVAPVVGGRYSLSEVPEALRCIGEGRALGKLVIVVEGGGAE